MTVGELSCRTGVWVKNLRQYTDDGLIYTMGRSSAGYRLFGTEALWCVRRIGQLRGLGLTVAEIRQLIRAYRHRTECPPGPQLAASLRRSRDRVQARIADMQRTLARIDEFEATHQRELTDPASDHWAGDPRRSGSG
ncbi:MAG: MerR family transcriptional regulator [Actinophytocola sp.]|nr:MerR family transcriptional regulator [Actinophytocola sp.]